MRYNFADFVKKGLKRIPLDLYIFRQSGLKNWWCLEN